MQCGQQVDSDGRAGDKYLAAAENSEAGPRPVVRLLSASPRMRTAAARLLECVARAVEGTG